MRDFGDRLTSISSRFLEPWEREAVLGDLTQAGEGGWRGLFGLLGLLLRRQAEPWRNWRPWLAAFGLAFPGSFLLMGYSLSVSQAYQHWLGPEVFRRAGLTIGPGFWLLLCNLVLLCGWAWTGGCAVGTVSRRTIWVSAGRSFSPCLFCLERFRVESISRLCLLLFLPPALWGVRRGLRIARIEFGSSVLLAIGLTALSIPTWKGGGWWIPNWALSWPAWYLVVTSHRPRWLTVRSHLKAK